jgi:hypothetical protein
MKKIKQPEVLHIITAYGLLEKVKTKDASAAKQLYKIFVDRTRNQQSIDPRLTDFVCNNLEALANGDEPKQAMHLINRRGKYIDDRRNRRIIERFFHFMDKLDTTKPSHVQEQVGKEFFITGDQAIRIYLDKKNSDFIKTIRNIRASFQPMLDISKKYKKKFGKITGK